jgi:hypothetical protein
MYQQRRSNHGEIEDTGTDLCEAPANNQTLVKSLRVTHSTSFQFELYFYDASTSASSIIYTLNLSAGDILTDTFPYHLNEGDKLTAIATPTDAPFSIEFESGPALGVRCK